MTEHNSKASKFLSLVLRHDPAEANLIMDPYGYVDAHELVSALQRRGLLSSMVELRELVESNDKRRFAFDSTGEKIRASQGHSVTVDLQLEPESPPNVLFHGTVQRFLAGIAESGLLPRSRNHVHLSAEAKTATAVGGRRGAPIILTVRAGELARTGHLFYKSANGVWLTRHVPYRYIDTA